MQKETRKPTVRSMYLRFQYRRQHHTNLTKLINDEVDGSIWESCTNKERTYVLTGTQDIRRRK